MTKQMTSPSDRSVDPARPTKRVLFRDRWTLPLLILLTLVGGLLRFASLDRPSIWGDEAATYGRVAGSYAELLDQLTDSSFPPLHYELEWWIGQGLPVWGSFSEPAGGDGPRTFTPSHCLVPGGIKLSPFVLRFVPALAGTLFVPAVYFLARQLFGRRVALTAAFLACFSAYALVYSRDAKMYMHFWLAVTLHVGCLLWWLRTRRGLAWALWLASGLAMIGLHLSGATLLIVDAVIVLTRPPYDFGQFPRLLGLLLWPLGVVPALLVEWVGQKRRWERSPWDRFLAWPRPAWRRLRVPSVVGFVIGLAVMAAAPLGPLGYSSAFSQKLQTIGTDLGLANPADLVNNRWAAATAGRGLVSVDRQGIGWVENYNAGRKLPDYLLYTASAYLTGWEWPRKSDVPEWNDQARVPVRTLRLLQGATIGLLALLVVGLVPWRRAFSAARARLDRITQSRSTDPRARHWRVLWLGVWITVVPWAAYTGSTARPATVLDAAAAVALKQSPDVNWPRLPAKPTPKTPTTAPASVIDEVERRWVDVREATIVAAGEWPGAWKAYTAAFRRDNLNVVGLSVAGVIAAGLLLLVVTRPRRLGGGAIVLIAVGVLLIAVCTFIGLMPRKFDKDVWMPRYLGVIFPAVLLVVAVLIDHQPRWLRGVTLGLFVAVNMAQFGARVWGDSEPPTALMAADVVAAQPKSKIPTHDDRPTFKAFTAFGRFSNAEPGGGTLFQPAGLYYLRELSGVPGQVAQVRNRSYVDNLAVSQLLPGPLLPGVIARNVNDSPWVTRFVVWTGMGMNEVDQTDVLADLLKGQFRCVKQEFWTARDHWRWTDRFKIERRTYERVSGPTTKPE